jgi:hypothetical protein
MTNNTLPTTQAQPLSCNIDDADRRLANALRQQLRSARAYPAAVSKILADRPDLHPSPRSARRALDECVQLVSTVLA